jgi:glutaredoxin
MKITCNKDGIVKWEEDFDEVMSLIKNVNLLPKECQMKTRYVVVNLKEKEEFEKKWEMSYGYNNSPYIGFNQKEAIKWINQNLGPNERKDYVVERHNAGKTDVVWKILDGHKLAGEEEQEEHDFDEEF